MLWAVIMAGGSGTRFWPESRARKPKQFLKILGRKTLLEATAARLSPLIPKSRLLIVTHERHRALSARLARVPLSRVLGEPAGRNTAPCAILSAMLTVQKDPEAVLALLPADNYVGNTALFRKALQTAYGLAKKENLPVTFGIRPASPHTGYGYLETGNKAASRNGFRIYRLRRFREKPSLELAKQFLKSKRFLWNSGMFVWKARALLDAARKYLPSAYRTALKIAEGNVTSGLRKYFPGMPNISIDYGLMEKMAGRILTIPVDFGWSDLGGWQSLADFWPQDKDGNAVKGNAVFAGSSGNIVKSDRRLIALAGVKDLTVIDTGDAVLVSRKDAGETLRNLVRLIGQKKLGAYL